MPTYIHDGYTAAFYIAARSGLHEPIRGHYRPLLTEERARVARQIAGEKDAGRSQRLAAAIIKRQLVDWDVRDRGREVSMELEEILRLQVLVFNRLYEIVMGFDAGDEDPEKLGSNELEPSPELLVERILAGQPYDAEAEDEKNLLAG